MRNSKRLTYKDYQKVLTTVKYKPKSTFSLENDPVSQTVLLKIELPLMEDSGNTIKLIEGDSLSLSWRSPVSPLMTKSDFYNFVTASIVDAELHEIGEWLEIDGQKLFHPHQKIEKVS